MATGARKPTAKQTKAIAKVALEIVVNAVVPDCEALYAASEAIQQLITENCAIVQSRGKKKAK